MKKNRIEIRICLDFDRFIPFSRNSFSSKDTIYLKRVERIRRNFANLFLC